MSIGEEDQRESSKREPLNPLLVLLWYGIGVASIVFGYVLAPMVGLCEYLETAGICLTLSIPGILVLAVIAGIVPGSLIYRGLRRGASKRAATLWSTACTAIICLTLGFLISAVSCWIAEGF
jgi:hypothetical protein